MKLSRRRYQSGCLYPEKRKSGPDVWLPISRWAEQPERADRPVEQFPTRKAAMQACELLRVNINRDAKITTHNR